MRIYRVSAESIPEVYQPERPITNTVTNNCKDCVDYLLSNYIKTEVMSLLIQQ